MIGSGCLWSLRIGTETTSCCAKVGLLLATYTSSIIVYSGADDVILQRSSSVSDEHQELQDHLHSFACDGLRTLVLAYRIVSQAEVEQFLSRQKSSKLKFLSSEDDEDPLDSIEKDLLIVGATGIEDELQQGVVETVRQLMDNNMKLWVLTGDKLEVLVDNHFDVNSPYISYIRLQSTSDSPATCCNQICCRSVLPTARIEWRCWTS